MNPEPASSKGEVIAEGGVGTCMISGCGVDIRCEVGTGSGVGAGLGACDSGAVRRVLGGFGGVAFGV